MTNNTTAEQYVSDLIDNGKTTGLQILVVCLCLLFNMLDGFDITAMAVAAKQVSTELGLPDDQVGLIFSFALAGMMMGAMFLASFSDVIGRKKMIIGSLVLIGVTVLLTARATSLTEFIILRFISGLGGGALLASQATLAAEFCATRYKALAVSLVTAGYPLGAMMTGVMAGHIMPDYGWRGLFIFGGSITVVMALLAVALLPESLQFLLKKQPDDALPKSNKILARMKRPSLATLPVLANVEEVAKGNIFSKMKQLLVPEYRSKTLILWSAFFLAISTLYFLLSWVPKMMEDAGYTATIGRTAFIYLNLGGVLGVFILGGLSVRFKLTKIIFWFLIIAAAAMVLFANLPNELNMIYILIFIIGLTQQGGYTGLYSVAAKYYPTEIRSTGVGWAIGLGRAGAVAGPYLAGTLLASGMTMSGNFMVFAVPVAISAFVALLLDVR